MLTAIGLAAACGWGVPAVDAQPPAAAPPTTAAILTEAVAYFDCEVGSIVEAGDHFVVLGRIEDAAVLNERAPLTSASGLRYRPR